MTRLLLSSHAFVAVPFFVAGCGGCGSQLPVPSAGVQWFTTTQRVQIRPTDRSEWNKPGYQVIKLVTLNSGDSVVPLLQVKEPRFTGWFGGVRTELVWQDPLMFLGERRPFIRLPVDNTIKSHIIIVRSAGSPEGPWRIWEVASHEIQDDGSLFLIMPRFEKLELLSSRNDGEELLTKCRAAEVFQHDLDK